MHGSSSLTLSSIRTGGTFSPPAVISNSGRQEVKINLDFFSFLYHTSEPSRNVKPQKRLTFPMVVDLNVVETGLSYRK